MMRRKVKHWIARYLPAEVAGTIAAVVAGTVVYWSTHNAVATALAGAWGENAGYYGVILASELVHSRRVRPSGASRAAYSATRLRDLAIEFGPSELLDSFVFRPLFMYLLPALTGNVQLGIILGKLAADVTFYVPTVIAYELRNKYLSK